MAKSNIVKQVSYNSNTGLAVNVNAPSTYAKKRTVKLNFTNTLFPQTYVASQTVGTTTPFTDTAGRPNGRPIVVPGETKVDWTSPGTLNPLGFKFNLPPHSWSMPLRPRSTSNEYVYKQTKEQQAFDLVTSVVEKERLTDIKEDTAVESFHGLRRGRMWHFLDNELISKINEGVGEGNNWRPLTRDEAIKAVYKKSKVKAIPDNAWGFQFLWNPTEFSTTVNINMDVTPSANDRFRAMTGVFPGQETLTINLVLDRTNDFACIKGSSLTFAEDFQKYYTNRYPFEDITTETFKYKLEKLMALGTVADLEYLFKTVNGKGFGDTEWTNLLGRKTADVGYIQPTLVGIQLGPGRDSLSYVGWINNVSINHVSFTEAMIPLRTVVSLTVACATGSGQKSS